jgi:hypothetical protein
MAVGMRVIRINIARFFWKHLLASDWILKAIYYIDFSRMRGTTTDAGSNGTQLSGENGGVAF